MKKKDEEILISIIIPVYNIESYLSCCLDSILEQSYSKLQIILIDDGSTDGSGQICESYAKKDYRIEILHTKNQGASQARNRGIDLAKGEYLVFIDGDDYVGKDYILQIVQAAQQMYDMVICLGFYRYNNEKGIALEKAQFNDISGIYYNDIELLNKMGEQLVPAWSCWQMVVRRTVVEQHQFKFSEEYIRGEDLDFFVRVAQKCKSIYVTNICEYYYRIQREGSAMCSISGEKLLSEMRVFCKYYYEYRGKAQEWQEFLAEIYISKILIITALKDKKEIKMVSDFIQDHKEILREKHSCHLHRMYKGLAKVFGIYHSAKLTQLLLDFVQK